MKIPSIFLIVFIIISLSNASSPDSTQFDSTITEDDSTTLEVVESNGINFKIFKSDSVIAAFVGSLLAGLIAIISIWRTNRNNRKLEEDKFERDRLVDKLITESKYCGVLIAIDCEFSGHQNMYNLLLAEIEEIKQKSLEAADIVVSSCQMRVPFDFLDKCRLILLEYDMYNTILLNSITHYRNSLSNLNSSLNFELILDFTRNYKGDPINIVEAIDNYFDVILKHASKLRDHLPDVRDTIKSEIKKFPHIKLIEGTPDSNKNGGPNKATQADGKEPSMNSEEARGL